MWELGSYSCGGRPLCRHQWGKMQGAVFSPDAWVRVLARQKGGRDNRRQRRGRFHEGQWIQRSRAAGVPLLPGSSKAAQKGRLLGRSLLG